MRLTKKSAYAPEYGDSGGQPSLSLRYERRTASEMTACEFATGSRFEVGLECGSFFAALKGVEGFDMPRTEFRGMGASALVVL